MLKSGINSPDNSCDCQKQSSYQNATGSHRRRLYEGSQSSLWLCSWQDSGIQFGSLLIAYTHVTRDDYRSTALCHWRTQWDCVTERKQTEKHRVIHMTLITLEVACRTFRVDKGIIPNFNSLQSALWSRSKDASRSSCISGSASCHPSSGRKCCRSWQAQKARQTCEDLASSNSRRLWASGFSAALECAWNRLQWRAIATACDTARY
jgi:hypothetical protein